MERKATCCPTEEQLDSLTKFIRMKISMDRFFSPLTQRYSLTPMLYMTLNLISMCESPTVSSVFRTLELNQGNVSSMCKKLEADGFIVRSKNKDDERQVTLSVTEKGRAAIDGVCGEMSRLRESANLTSEDYDSARQNIEALSAFAEKLAAAVNDPYTKGIINA